MFRSLHGVGAVRSVEHWAWLVVVGIMGVRVMIRFWHCNEALLCDELKTTKRRLRISIFSGICSV